MTLALLVLAAGVGCSGDPAGGERAAVSPGTARDPAPPPLPKGWQLFSRATPRQQDLECARYAKRAWEVREASVGHEIRAWLPGRASSLRLPLNVPPQSGAPEAGIRHAIQTSDGWLAGYDAGEFGGGLWWFGEDDGATALLAPDNVRGIAAFGPSFVALLGRAHTDSGQVVLISSSDGRWSVVRRVELGSSPEAFAYLDDHSLLIATDHGMLKLTRAFDLEVLTKGPYVFSNSVVYSAAGDIYVGMRAFVVRLTQTEEEWREDWLTPAPCPTLRRVGSDCVCVDPAESEGRHRHPTTSR